MGTPMEGFFDGADVVAKVMASASAAVVQRVVAESLVPPLKPILVKESTQAERVVNGESTSIPVKILTPQKELTPIDAS